MTHNSRKTASISINFIFLWEADPCFFLGPHAAMTWVGSEAGALDTDVCPPGLNHRTQDLPIFVIGSHDHQQLFRWTAVYFSSKIVQSYCCMVESDGSG